MSDDIEFDFADDEETPAPKQEQKDKAAFAQMRKELKELQPLAKEVEELRAFKAEREKADRQVAVSTAFQTLGINPKHAKFFDGEEATEDAIKAWAVENEFLAPAEGETPSEPAEVGYTPTVIAEVQAPGNKVYSFDEWMELSTTDPAKANQIWKADRVAGVVRD